MQCCFNICKKKKKKNFTAEWWIVVVLWWFHKSDKVAIKLSKNLKSQWNDRLVHFLHSDVFKSGEKRGERQIIEIWQLHYSCLNEKKCTPPPTHKNTLFSLTRCRKGCCSLSTLPYHREVEMSYYYLHPHQNLNKESTKSCLWSAQLTLFHLSNSWQMLENVFCFCLNTTWHLT